jgi:uncharacterized cupredoxin-like copper-binding protein
MKTIPSFRLPGFLATAAVSLVIGITPALADAGHAHGIGQPGKAGKSTRTVNVTLDENYYSPSQIKVRPGETVRFVLTNRGAIEHEFTIGTPAMNAEHRKMMRAMKQSGQHGAAGHGAHGAGHGGMMHHDEPNAVMVDPGETKELVWKFDKAGQLEFACNIPNHYESGMVGKLEIRK